MKSLQRLREKSLLILTFRAYQASGDVNVALEAARRSRRIGAIRSRVAASSSALLLQGTQRALSHFDLSLSRLTRQRVSAIARNFAAQLVIVGKSIGRHARAHGASRLIMMSAVAKSTALCERGNVVECRV
jgi:hypothetical protein